MSACNLSLSRCMSRCIWCTFYIETLQKGRLLLLIRDISWTFSSHICIFRYCLCPFLDSTYAISKHRYPDLNLKHIYNLITGNCPIRKWYGNRRNGRANRKKTDAVYCRAGNLATTFLYCHTDAFSVVAYIYICIFWSWIRYCVGFYCTFLWTAYVTLCAYTFNLSLYLLASV